MKAARIALLALATIALAIVLLPYSVGRGDDSETQRSCIAIRDGWDTGPPAPTVTELRTVAAHVQTLPTPPSSAADAAALLERERSWEQSAPAAHVFAYSSWYESGGKCSVDGGRDRLKLALAGLVIAGVGVTGLWFWNRRSGSVVSTESSGRLV